MKSQNNKTLLIISLVAIVNALGYGIIIPLLYAYGTHFGVSAFQSGFLFASFSLAQFISTPIIGRLSDKYGRKPLLFISVLGSALSFLTFALAQNAFMLFLARIMDGITGGNISVAQAVISDTTEPKDRAKWFGVLGASFGMGFLVGPAIGGYLSTFFIQAPFYLATVVSLACALLIQFGLKETLHQKSTGKTTLEDLFHIHKLVASLFEPFVGLVLSASFITNMAFSIFILGFQAFTSDYLKLHPSQISMLFVIFGAIGLVMQGFGVGKLVNKFGEINMMFFGAFTTTLGFFLMGLSNTLMPFIGASIVLAIGNSFLAPVMTTLLSKHTKKEDQGGIMGINQSYVSLSSVVGPIIGGFLASSSVHGAFYGAALVLLILIGITFIISREHGKHIVDL